MRSVPIASIEYANGVLVDGEGLVETDEPTLVIELVLVSVHLGKAWANKPSILVAKPCLTLAQTRLASEIP